jgi:hypothetical protein
MHILVRSTTGQILKRVQCPAQEFQLDVSMQVDIQREYDLVQLIGEGWCSRVYLAERRSTREEVGSNVLTMD